jgi:hypothetical protein
MPPRFEPRLLERVFGVLVAADHPVRVRRQLAAKGLDERAKRGFVATLRGVDEHLFASFEHDR